MIDEATQPRLAGILYERLSRYLRVTPESGKAFDAIKRALELVPASPPSEERARVLAGYSGRLSLLGQLREAGHVAEQAVVMAREVGVAVVECGALNTLGVVTCYLDDDAKGLRRIEDALTLATAIGDPYQPAKHTPDTRTSSFGSSTGSRHPAPANSSNYQLELSSPSRSNAGGPANGSRLPRGTSVWAG